MGEAQSALRKGWFIIPGVQTGDRTLEMQCQGLEAVDFTDKTVLDLGCAEGLIARYALKERGAVYVHGIDIIPEHIVEARVQCLSVNARFSVMNLKDFPVLHPKTPGIPERFDIVLLLSILHKLTHPLPVLDYIARLAPVLVIRLPSRRLNDQRSGYLNRDIPAYLSERFALVAQPKTCLQEWMGVFNRKVAP